VTVVRADLLLKFLPVRVGVVACVVLLLVRGVSVVPQAGDPIPGYLNQITAANLEAVATDLVTLYGPRTANTYSPFLDASCTPSPNVYPKSTIEMSADYVKARFESMGYAPTSITMEEVPGGVGHNVFVTKVGATYPNVFIEFSAHLDTVAGTPGGNDNASGATAVVELARVLRDYPSRYSLRFALWVSEEYSSQFGAYYGSTYHVQEALARGEHIKAGLVMDHIGWPYPGDPTGYMNQLSYSGTEAEWIASLFNSVRSDYGIAIGYGADGGVQNSDQRAYWSLGQTAVLSGGGFVYNHPNYHDCGDTISNISFTNVLRTAQQNLAVGLKLDAEPFYPGETTTRLVSQPNPSVYGQEITLTATVIAAAGTPTGVVAFKDADAVLGTATLDASGVAAVTVSGLTLSLHSLTAVYQGNSEFSPSTSNVVSHSVALTGNPVPLVTDLEPASVTAGAEAFTFAVHGSDFVATSVVRWNGSDRPTTFVSASLLTAAIGAGDVGFSGSAQVTVFNPTPGGGTSAALTFTIAPPPPEAGLMAAYSMDEGAGTSLVDRSGQSNLGTLMNGTAWGTGRNGGGITFDGINDYVIIPSSPTIDVSGTNLTVEFWTNVLSGGSTPDYVVIGKPWTSGQMNSPYYQYGVEFWGGSQQFVFFIGTALGVHSFPMAGSYAAWHHVAFTYDGGYVRGYLDGVLKFTTPETTSLTARGTDLLLGVDGTLRQGLKGSLDDLRIYGRALSQAEIQTDMNTPVGPGAPPTITSFAPTNGPPGALVTISGTVFSGATCVTFSTTDATLFSVTNDSQIVATVPVGATTGPIHVTTSAGTATSAATFTVEPNPEPVLTSFSPTSGVVGTLVTLTGTGFTGASAVSFNGTVAPYTVVTDATITATVPAGATSGTVQVTTPGGTATSAVAFTVVPAPVITTVSPTSGAVGTAVTLTGTGFTGATAVSLNGTAASYAISSDTTITTTVPLGATSGLIQVTTPGGTASSATAFTVVPAPVITTVSPTSGAVGTAVTLTGTGFTGASAVSFNGTSQPVFTVVSDTTITTTVPVGATSGPVQVTTPGGTGTSATAFTVVLPPTIASVSPATGPAAGGQTVTVAGTYLSGTSAATFGGTTAAVVNVTATAVTVTTPPHAAGVVDVVVTTPGGTVTAAAAYTYTNPIPRIKRLNPSSKKAGSPAFTLIVNGANFVPDSVVRWNGLDRPTMYVSATQVNAAIPASDLISVGTAQVSVFNPAPGGGTSNAATIAIKR